MATKRVDKRGTSMAGQPAEEGKLSSPKDKSALSLGGASGVKATEVPPTAEWLVPNEETAQVLRETREGKNLLHYEDLEAMFKDLGI